MYKGLLIFLVSLGSRFCLAQDSSAGIPLPVETANIVPDSALYITDLVSVIKDNAKVILNWRIVNSSAPDFVAVERSCGGRDFEMIALLKQSSNGSWYEWMDEAPAKGRNLYRVRFAGKQGAVQYSKTIPAIVAGDISFRFYPNPVDNILIIRSESILDIQIIDGNGKVRLAQNRIQRLQTINVASLEKGMYLLRINNLSTGIISQERLLKN